jgi:phosphohistidine phosphatase
MKSLAVLRHAKSSWDQQQLEDFDRPLSTRGRAAARRMGIELKRRELDFDLVLASTAARVRETIDGVKETFDLRAPVVFEQRIYLAAEQQLLSIIRGLSEDVRLPLIVGHNPALERLILELASEDEDHLRERVARKFPTGAFALLELPATRWSHVRHGRGKILELILPKDLD